MRRLAGVAILPVLLVALASPAEATCFVGRPTFVGVGIGDSHGVYGTYWQECLGYDLSTDASVTPDVADPLAPAASAAVDLPQVLVRYQLDFDLVFGSLVVPLYHGSVDASTPACIGGAAGAQPASGTFSLVVLCSPVG